jgi:hypothetical protein
MVDFHGGKDCDHLRKRAKIYEVTSKFLKIPESLGTFLLFMSIVQDGIKSVVASVCQAEEVKST